MTTLPKRVSDLFDKAYKIRHEAKRKYTREEMLILTEADTLAEEHRTEADTLAEEHRR